MSYYSLPYIYEKDGSLEKSWDIYSRLLKDRIIFIGSVIDDFIANSIVAQLLFLQMENPSADISIYINSPGGSITAGLAIIDTMNFVSCKIKTFCIGMCGNIASLILSNGTKGFRHSLPHSRILIYQPVGSFSGQTADIVLAAREIQKWRSFMNKILSKNTGNSEDKINSDTNRNYSLDARESRTYGIIDNIISVIK